MDFTDSPSEVLCLFMERNNEDGECHMSNVLTVVEQREILGKDFRIYGDIENYSINNVIYRISFSNGKNYIGQTTNTALDRILQHIRTSKYNTKNYPIYNAMRKFDAFDLFIECICKNIDELNIQESIFIQKYNSINNGYNCDSGGSNKVLSQETRDKISNSKKGWKMTIEQRSKLSASTMGRMPWNKGTSGLQRHTESQNKEMSKRMAGINNPMYGKAHSQETKDLQSRNRKGNTAWNKGLSIDNSHHNIKIQCIDTGNIYESITQASECLCIDRSSIVKVCKGKQKTAKGLKFRYMEVA